ncbi:hypothetical protein GobsT_63310 [Gemmata obscuriglobus]|uniref:Uncharacterized protein n=1 Tax=Gemmata obscuriglobus TaxID=114 RepID=A0A2Z3H2U6_9BACT|nr:hypothetical protein [Gemmata obscuriglobus]AWM35934.1 hypothetical protein C1280_02170 [Gemmata obscuriglobus]QEG31509.1 hypothetical protein GobsT_63310 [Gemmata obscuriglobus]VTS10851.1 unnamed protein product [Gemmata obscuriglobus UQM 2246]
MRSPRNETTDAEGQVYDFHYERHAKRTDSDRMGVRSARAQKLMRHSTPDLTAKHHHHRY